MELNQFKNIFEDYSLSIEDKVTLHFSFEHGHRIETFGDSPPLDEKDLQQVQNSIDEFLQRNRHRLQLIQEIVDYIYQLPNESELKALLAQVEEIKGIPTSLIIEKLSERSPTFFQKRIHELLQTIQEEEGYQE